MGSNLKIRIILNILIMVAIAVFPWWFSVALIIFGIFTFKSFYEAIFFGMVIDSVYGVHKNLFFGYNFVFILLFLILITFVEWMKKRLRVY